MRFVPTPISDLFSLEIDRRDDSRGFFARTFCQSAFEEHGIHLSLAQSSVSYNLKAGTIRGLHYQAPPHAEAKLVRCTRGRLWDVAVDLREDSPTFCNYFAIELSADNYRSLYIPAGFAHGFQALTDDTEVLYDISTEYREESSRGFRWDDPAFRISWPLPCSVLSPRDQSLPLIHKESFHWNP